MIDREPVILGPGEGRVLRTPAGDGPTLKIGVGQTGGAATIFESSRPHGDLGGPPQHRHAFDEAFYILEGDYVFQIEDRLIHGTVGSFFFAPGGTAHAFRHAGEGPGRLLTFTCPGGIEEMFAENTPDQRQAIERKLGVEWLGPPLSVESDEAPDR